MNFLKSFSILAFLIGGALSADADTECWSLKLGYPCCQLKTTRVSYTDKATGNLYGVEFNKMCGITSAQLCPKGDTYKCCSSCTVTYIDTYYWGIEDGQWCSIPYDCEDEINAIVKKTTSKKGKTTTITSTKTKAITTIVIEPVETATVEPVISTISVEPVISTISVEPVISTISVEPVISTISVEPVETATILPVTSTITVEPVETEVPKCARVFEMCGGSAFPDVPTCCEEGSFCWSLNEAYHQCIPEYLKEFTEVKTTTEVENPTTKVENPTTKVEVPTTKVEEPTVTTIAATTTEAQVGTNGCALNFQPCGGLSNPDAPNCCQEGFTCYHNDAHYHQCIPKFYLESTTTTTTTKPTTTTTVEEVVSQSTTATVVEVSSVATSASEVTTLPAETEVETETEIETSTTTVTEVETETDTETETETEPSETIGQVAPTTTPVAPDAVCGKLYDACGGSDYPNTPTCCEPGSVCIVLNTSTYQCLPERLPIGIFRPPPPPPRPYYPYYPLQPYTPQNPPPAYYPPPPPSYPFNPNQPYGPQNPLPNYPPPPPPAYPRPYNPQPYYPPPPQPYTPQNPPPAYYPPPPPPYDPEQE